MRVVHKLTVHMDDRRCVPYLDMMQLDADTRVLELTLLCGGEAWEVPSGKTVSVAFRKNDGHGGWYSKLPDGTTACSVSGNVVTAVLAPQVLTAAGKTRVSVVVQDPSTLDQIAAFPVTIDVAPNPAAGQGVSECYFEYQTMADVNAALEGFDQELEELRGSIGSGLMTEERIAALDAMFRVVAYIKEDVSAEYGAFRVAFGLDAPGDSGDSGGGAVVGVEWELGTLFTDGSEMESTTRLRTVSYLPEDIVQITVAEGYLLAICCFDASGGIPANKCYFHFPSMSFVSSAASADLWTTGVVDMAAIREAVGEYDQFRLLLKREDDGEMTVDESTNVTLTKG